MVSCAFTFAFARMYKVHEYLPNELQIGATMSVAVHEDVVQGTSIGAVIGANRCGFVAKVRRYFDSHQGEVPSYAFERLHDLLIAFLEVAESKPNATCDLCILDVLLANGGWEVTEKTRSIFTKAVHKAIKELGGTA